MPGIFLILFTQGISELTYLSEHREKCIHQLKKIISVCPCSLQVWFRPQYKNCTEQSPYL